MPVVKELERGVVLHFLGNASDKFEGTFSGIGVARSLCKL